MLLPLVLRTAFEGMLSLPRGVLRRLAGPPIRSDRGHDLDLESQFLLKLNERMGPPAVHTLGAVKGREENARGGVIVDARPVAVHEVRELRIPGPAGTIAARLYVPEAAPATRPVLVFVHGGCFVFGSLDSHDTACRKLAKACDALVVSIDYRLAPEHPFPAGLDDAEAAFVWVHENAASFGGDPECVGIVGDSAGGNLAAMVSLRRKRAGHPRPAFQVLIYPMADLTRALPSQRTFANGYLLDEPTLKFTIGCYLDGAEAARAEDASPLHAPDLVGLPPTVIVTCGFDPLRDEGERLADALADAGVPLTRRCEESLLHAFLTMGALRSCREASERVHRDIRAAITSARSADRGRSAAAS